MKRLSLNGIYPVLDVEEGLGDFIAVVLGEPVDLGQAAVGPGRAHGLRARQLKHAGMDNRWGPGHYV